MSSFGYKAVGTTATNDEHLTNLSIQYRNPLVNFVYDKGVFTNVTVSDTTGKIVKYNQENIRDFNIKVPFGYEGKKVTSTIGTPISYDLEHYSAQDVVTDVEKMKSAKGPIAPFEDKTAALTEVLEIQKEVDAAALYTAASAGNTLSGTDQWNDYDNSDPVGNIKAALATMAGNGIQPNIAVIPYHVWINLKFHPALLSLLGSNRTAVMTEQTFAELFGLDRVFVPKNIYDTSNFGQNTATRTFIWGKNFWLAQVNQAPQRVTSTFGVMVTAPGMRKVVRKYNDLAGSTIIQVEDACDFVQTDANSVYRIATVIA